MEQTGLCLSCRRIERHISTPPLLPLVSARASHALTPSLPHSVTVHTSHILIHSVHTYSGIVGSGLCVFSRHPIMSAHTHQFSVTGGVHAMADGEVFAGKGIMITKIKTPGGTVALYNTHVRVYVLDSALISLMV